MSSLSARWSVLFITLAISISRVFYHFSAVPLWTALHLSARSLEIQHVENSSLHALFSYQVIAAGTYNLSLAWWKPPQADILSTFLLQTIEMFLHKIEDTHPLKKKSC